MFAPIPHKMAHNGWLTLLAVLVAHYASATERRAGIGEPCSEQPLIQCVENRFCCAESSQTTGKCAGMKCGKLGLVELSAASGTAASTVQATVPAVTAVASGQAPSSSNVAAALKMLNKRPTSQAALQPSSSMPSSVSTTTVKASSASTGLPSRGSSSDRCSLSVAELCNGGDSSSSCGAVRQQVQAFRQTHSEVPCEELHQYMPHALLINFCLGDDGDPLVLQSAVHHDLRLQFRALGVPEENIIVADSCNIDKVEAAIQLKRRGFKLSKDPFDFATSQGGVSDELMVALLQGKQAACAKGEEDSQGRRICSRSKTVSPQASALFFSFGGHGQAGFTRTTLSQGLYQSLQITSAMHDAYPSLTVGQYLVLPMVEGYETRHALSVLSAKGSADQFGSDKLLELLFARRDGHTKVMMVTDACYGAAIGYGHLQPWVDGDTAKPKSEELEKQSRDVFLLTRSDDTCPSVGSNTVFYQQVEKVLKSGGTFKQLLDAERKYADTKEVEYDSPFLVSPNQMSAMVAKQMMNVNKKLSVQLKDHFTVLPAELKAASGASVQTRTALKDILAIASQGQSAPYRLADRPRPSSGFQRAHAFGDTSWADLSIRSLFQSTTTTAATASN